VGARTSTAVDAPRDNEETALYTRIGTTYSATRAADPRIAAAIRAALGDARSVLNVGAGTGAYEPTDFEVLAVEPSAAMIAQRPPGAAPALRGSAEALPVADGSFDAASLSTRFTTGKISPPACASSAASLASGSSSSGATGRKGTPFWLVERYFRVLDEPRKSAAITAAIERELGPVTELPVPLPRNCSDGLFGAYWGRPEAYLNDDIRRNISNFALASERKVAQGLERLRTDLECGEWDRRYGQLRALPELDLGHRIVVAVLAPPR
jgi:SAM-dependent methyltransferase